MHFCNRISFPDWNASRSISECWRVSKPTSSGNKNVIVRSVFSACGTVDSFPVLKHLNWIFFSRNNFILCCPDIMNRHSESEDGIDIATLLLISIFLPVWRNKGERGLEPSEVVLPITSKMYQHDTSRTQHWTQGGESTKMSWRLKKARKPPCL